MWLRSIKISGDTWWRGLWLDFSYYMIVVAVELLSRLDSQNLTQENPTTLDRGTHPEASFRAPEKIINHHRMIQLERLAHVTCVLAGHCVGESCWKNQFCNRFDKEQVPQNLANHLWPVGVLQSWSFSLFLVCINESSWPSDWFKNVMTNALQAPGGSFHVAPTSPCGGMKIAGLQICKMLSTVSC